MKKNFGEAMSFTSYQIKKDETSADCFFVPARLRRNRKSSAIREMLQETRLHPSMLIAPCFVVEGQGQKQPIQSMPGVFRFSIDQLVREAVELYHLGIRSLNLFPFVPEDKKDRLGSNAFQPGNLLHRAISALKKEIPDLCIMADIALDPYTAHGHDGLINELGEVDNDMTLEALAKMSLLAAEAGVDIVAPSDMMDGRVLRIRKELDKWGYCNVSILSYAVKFVSAFYGPFRDALDSAPRFGDKKGYQVNPANAKEALRECLQDENEGADMLMIKPALPYLDIIKEVRQHCLLPVGAYQVSGEYAMIQAAAVNGWIDGDKALLESLLSIKRAGADFIFTYAAKHAAELLKRL